MMDYCLVLLQNRKKLVVPSDWVQHKNPRKSTKVFLSSVETKLPDFGLDIKYFIQPETDACYNGFFIRKFNNKSAALAAANKHRGQFPVDYRKGRRLKGRRVIEIIDLIADDDSESSNDDLENSQENPFSYEVSSRSSHRGNFPNRSPLCEIPLNMCQSDPVVEQSGDQTAENRGAMINIPSSPLEKEERTECDQEPPTKRMNESVGSSSEGNTVSRASKIISRISLDKNECHLPIQVPSSGQSTKKPTPVLQPVSAKKPSNVDSEARKRMNDFFESIKKANPVMRTASQIPSASLASHEKTTTRSASFAMPPVSVSNKYTEEAHKRMIESVGSSSKGNTVLRVPKTIGQISMDERGCHLPIRVPSYEHSSKKPTPMQESVPSEHATAQPMLKKVSAKRPSNFDVVPKWPSRDREIDREEARKSMDESDVSHRQPTVKELEIKLENSQKVMRILQEQVGTTFVASSKSNEDEHSEDNFSAHSHEIKQQDPGFAADFTYTTNANADRYYFDGRIKMSKSDVQILRGMNDNYLTSAKEFDYRFVSRLLYSICERSELAEGCVTIKSALDSECKYKQLEPIKFDFIKALFRERVKKDKQRFNTIFRLINAKCSSVRKHLSK